MNWTDKFKKMDYRNNYKPVEAVVPRCKSCGLRSRGVNHDEGSHHKARAK